MISIFDYLDFRKFLKDYFEEKKSRCPFFSYKYLASKAGFNNKGFIFNIINGSKRLSASNALKICSALGLDQNECTYFQNLVAMNQARSPTEKDHFYRQMEGIKKQPKKPDVWIVRKDQYEYYSKWHHSVLRALIAMHPAQKDPAWFGRQLHPPISGREARRSIDLLLRLGFIRKSSDGSWALSNKIISTGQEVKGIALCNFYEQHAGLAAETVKRLTKECRRFEGVTLGISRKSYEKIGAEFGSFIEKALAIAEQDTEADRIYQLMLQFYPLTKNASQGEQR